MVSMGGRQCPNWPGSLKAAARDEFQATLRNQLEQSYKLIGSAAQFTFPLEDSNERNIISRIGFSDFIFILMLQYKWKAIHIVKFLHLSRWSNEWLMPRHQLSTLSQRRNTQM